MGTKPVRLVFRRWHLTTPENKPTKQPLKIHSVKKKQTELTWKKAPSTQKCFSRYSCNIQLFASTFSFILQNLILYPQYAERKHDIHTTG